MLNENMRTRITMMGCLLACGLNAAAQTNTTPLVEFVGLTGKVLRKETPLSEVGKLPSSAEITNVVIGAGMPRSDSVRLTEAGFRALLDEAKPIKADDRIIFVYDYVPWYPIIAFRTKAGQFRAELNLGIGFLLYPDGRVVAFGFRPTSNKDTANKLPENIGTNAPNSQQ